MNPQDTKVLAECVQIEPDHLTLYQLDFIRARRDYLTREDKKTFAKVITKRDEEILKPEA